MSRPVSPRAGGCRPWFVPCSYTFLQPSDLLSELQKDAF